MYVLTQTYGRFRSMYIEYIKRFAKPFSLRVCSHLIPILTSFRFETYLHHAVTHNTPKSETRAYSALQITAMLSIPISTDQTTLQGTSLFVSGQNNLEMFLPKPKWAPHTHQWCMCNVTPSETIEYDIHMKLAHVLSLISPWFVNSKWIDICLNNLATDLIRQSGRLI